MEKSKYPSGWDIDREGEFRLWYGEMRRVKGVQDTHPENPDDGDGLSLRRTYLEEQLHLLPEVAR